MRERSSRHSVSQLKADIPTGFGVNLTSDGFELSKRGDIMLVCHQHALGVYSTANDKYLWRVTY